MRMKPLVALLIGSFVGQAMAFDSSSISSFIQKGKDAIMGPADDAPVTLRPTKPGNTAPKPTMAPAAAIAAATPMSATPSAAAAPAAAVPAAASTAAEDAAVNPFTGEAVSAERRKREAERIRAENLVLEERIKQVNLMNDLTNAPAKKRIEMDNYVDTQRKNAPLPPVPVASLKPSMPSFEESAAPAVDKKLKKTTKTGKKVDTKSEPKTGIAVAPSVLVAPAPVPEVLGVIQTGEGATAILNNGGRTILARPGESSSLGVINEVSANRVQVGAHNLDFRGGSAIARVQRTDKEATKPDQAASATGSRYSLPPIPASPVQQGLPPTVRPVAPSAVAGPVVSPVANPTR